MYDFPDAAAFALQHHPNYLACLRHIGVTCGLAETSSAVAPWVRRDLLGLRILWLPRGVHWRFGDCTGSVAGWSRLRSVLPKHHLCLVGCETRSTEKVISQSGAIPVVTGATHAILPLTADATAMRARLRGKWRNALVRAEHTSLVTTRSPLDPLAHAPLLDLEARQRVARRYRALPRRFTDAWAARFPDQIQMMTACDGGEPVAYIVLLLHAPGATYHIGWTSEAGRRRNAHNLLLWRAAEWLGQRGYSHLDLGLLDTVSHPGLARFKLGMGPTVQTHAATLLCLPRLRRTGI